MKPNRGTFDLQRLFGCVACFSVAFGLPYLAARLIDNESLSYTARFSIAIVCLCLMGGCIGGGIGLLFNRFWRGFAWGVLGIAITCLLTIPFVPIVRS